jgi:hypothetical protein
LNGHIFVSQACAFGRCKCSIDGHIFVSQARAFGRCKCGLEWAHICVSSMGIW